ncbi:uncharacterized protein LOC129586977 [Paramacrobiotus metropolitanus]|uniref:uncharacterized protein LOC129586977 n=1 Tax=Paramacrobiotus metropolitanus TaxID=2943436 RepID=UPI002445D0C1|nr:uncharacterized protein LOC129586977 [Paramacrobiotus metropolitanus]
MGIRRCAIAAGFFIIIFCLTSGIGSSNAADLSSLPSGLSESLASVLDCNVNGKSGLCVPSVLKDVVCTPLGFQFAPDAKICGSDNVCCHSTVDSKPTSASPSVTTAVTIPPAVPEQAQKGSASILLLTAAKPGQPASSGPITDPIKSLTSVQLNAGSDTPPSNADKVANIPLISKPSTDKDSGKPQPFNIPASLSAFLPSANQAGDDDDGDAAPTISRVTKKPPGALGPVKLCRVGSSQGMCVKSDLVKSLCLPLGFATSPQGCSPNYMCCFTPDPDDNNIPTVPPEPAAKAPVNKPNIPIPSIKITNVKDLPITKPVKQTPVSDNPTSMDTCSPSNGQPGLCIRSDIAPMVCTPLGYAIGDRLTCAYDRVCCYLDKSKLPTDATNQAPSPTPNTLPVSATGPNPRPCQLGPGINGVCVPANLIQSCPLFGKKVSAFGCATRHMALPNYCCYEEQRNAAVSLDGIGSVRKKPLPDDLEPMQPFISVAGAETVPRLDSIVCGRKGLTGIEPRALARRAKMLGSHPTLPGEFCWHAALFDADGKPFCNGVLLHREWVLTAAHCVKRVPPAKTVVRLGLWALNGTTSSVPNPILPPAQTFRVLEAFVHYSYDAVTLDNNVALLHLDNQADFSEPQVCLICLPSQDNYDGSRCTVSSFSAADGMTFGPDSVLSQVDMNVMNSSDCEVALVNTGKLQNNFRLNGDVTLCAKGNPNEDTCRGDGGSGLTCQNNDGTFEVAGLVSWGLSCGLGAPTVLTRVWLYNSWIQEIIRRY